MLRMTSANLRLQDITGFSDCTGVILVQSSSNLFHSSVIVVGFLAITLLPRIFQRFWIGFRSGLCAGHVIISGFFASRNCFTHSAVWEGELSCMKIADWLGNECREGTTSCCWRFWQTFAFTLPCRCIRVPTPAAQNMTLPPPPFTDFFTHSGSFSSLTPNIMFPIWPKLNLLSLLKWTLDQFSCVLCQNTLLGSKYVHSLNNCLSHVSLDVSNKNYSFYMQICLAKVRFNKQYSEEKKQGIFRRNLGRLWSLFHSFDRLPLQDNEGKGLKEKRETLQGENDSNMIHSIWQVCMFRISHIPSHLTPHGDTLPIYYIAVVHRLVKIPDNTNGFWNNHLVLSYFAVIQQVCAGCFQSEHSRWRVKAR